MSKQRAEEGGSQPSVSRVTTSSVHVTVGPVVHLHDPPSHSTASQQAVVSVSHGDELHIPSASHSETAGAVTGEQLPPLLTSFDAHSVLDPLDAAFDMHSFTRSLLSYSSARSLSG